MCKANSHFARSFYFPYPKCDTYRFIREKRTRIRAVEGHANVEHFHIHSNMATMMTIAMAMPAGAPRATATSSSGVTGERRNQPSPSLGRKRTRRLDRAAARRGASPEGRRERRGCRNGFVMSQQRFNIVSRSFRHPCFAAPIDAVHLPADSRNPTPCAPGVLSTLNIFPNSSCRTCR